MGVQPQLAFCVREVEPPEVEVRVNFGVFAGRHVTPAEIDDLARALTAELDTFTIVAEQRHGRFPARDLRESGVQEDPRDGEPEQYVM